MPDTLRVIAQFGDLPLAILRSISTVSGDTYLDVDEAQLRGELAVRGFEPTRSALEGAMRALKDSGYLECTFTGSGVALIRLHHGGRQEVEGWPTAPGSLSAADVDKLVTSLDERSEDPTLAADERSKARAAATALRGLGMSVTGGLILGWLQRLGLR